MIVTLKRNSKKQCGRMKASYSLQVSVALDYTAISKGCPEEDGEKKA